MPFKPILLLFTFLGSVARPAAAGEPSVCMSRDLNLTAQQGGVTRHLDVVYCSALKGDFASFSLNTASFDSKVVAQMCDIFERACAELIRGKLIAIPRFKNFIESEDLQDSMYTLFDSGHITKGLIEKPSLDTFLRERKLELGDLYDQDTVKQLGRFSGSDYVLLGTFLAGNRQEFELNWRLIDCATGFRAQSGVITFQYKKKEH